VNVLGMSACTRVHYKLSCTVYYGGSSNFIAKKIKQLHQQVKSVIVWRLNACKFRVHVYKITR